MPDYSIIIKRSLEIVKKYKWLLVYGLILSGLGGGFNSLSLVNSFNQTPESTKEYSETSVKVLGAYTSSITEWVSTVTITTWLLVGLATIMLLIMTAVISFVIKAWAKGSLIYGVNLALKQEKPTLSNTSPGGIESIKSLVFLSIISFLFTFLTTVFLPAIWFVVFILVRNIELLNTVWIGLGGTAGIIVIFMSYILFAMTRVYAERFIVFEKKPAWIAWKEAFNLSRKSFLPTFVMGIVNTAVSSSVGCLGSIVLVITLGIPVLIILYPSIKMATFPSSLAIGSILIILITFAWLQFLIKAALTVFKYTNWNQIFEFIHPKDLSSYE